MTQTLSQLENSGAFIERHIGPDAAQQQEMLNAVGAQSLNALTGQIVPKDIQLATPPQVGAPATEYAALAELKAIASRNKRFTSYIGMGYTAVQLPPVILRNMLENPGWYTAYTPYQPEVSQGRLEALLNFQQVTLDLTGLDMASASLLDEATAAAEAMAMAKRVSKLKNANRFFVASDVHPQTLDVVRTRAETFGFEVIVDDAQKVLDHQDVFGVLLQQVGTTGEIHDYTALISELKSRKIVVSVAADIMALVLLTAPGKQGADIVFGSAQRFGVPMGYGGPHAAFFAAKDEYKRSMPGRIIGVSKDAAGNTALRMAMQTREQHIRREKANSNICTSQVLLANIASLYAVYHGPVGLKRIANRIHRLTDITLLAPAELQQVAWGENETFLTLKDGSMLTARLVIGADGANSWLRNKADIPLTFWDYQHHALVATIRTEEPHDAVARQVFHGEGILAFLPLSDPHLCSIVWSLSPEEAQRMQQASEDEFNRALNIAFDNRLGLCKVESARQVFPLTGRYARQFASHRLALVGDAAHTIHPLAGQGVNLGFMDAAELIAELKRLHRQGKDIGQYIYLRRYERSRKHSAALMLAGMQGFRDLFSGTNPAKKLLRDIGLKLADTLPGVKPQLIRQAMGLNDLPEWLR